MNERVSGPASTSEQSTPRGSRRALTAALACTVGAVHLLLVNHFVSLRAVFGDEPIYGVDFDLHIGQVFKVVEALEDFGRAWLYDVKMLAGHPEGTITDSGSKGWELWTFALHHYLGVPRAIAFNTFILLTMVACPVLLYAAAKTLRLSTNSALVAAAMGSSLWFFDSHIHWLWFVGMVSWALAASLSVLTLALFHRFAEERRAALAIPCGLSLGLGVLIHPYTFFALALPMGCIYIRAFRTLSRGLHACIVAMTGFTVAINLFWLLNSAKHWHYILNSAFFAQANLEFILCDALSILCSGADTGVIGTRTGFRFLYLGLAIVGLVSWRAQRDRRFLPILASVLSLYVVAYFGSYVPGLSQTQPYRQLTPGILVSTLPAAWAVEYASQLPWRTFPKPLFAVCVVAGLCLGQQLLTAQVLYFLPRLIPDAQPLLDGSPSPLSKYGFWTRTDVESHPHYGLPHSATLEAGMADVRKWVSANIPAGSRVLVEGGLLGERLAWSTEIEVLGGFTERNVAHVDANYFRKFQNYAANPAQLATYLRTYAVEWVISNRPEFALANDQLVWVTDVGGRRVYRRRAPVSRFLQGSGSVRATSNRIAVEHSKPGEPVELSYHYHEALICTPNCTVERASVESDRVGLIRVPAPHPESFVISNSYRFSRPAK